MTLTDCRVAVGSVSLFNVDSVLSAVLWGDYYLKSSACVVVVLLEMAGEGCG